MGVESFVSGYRNGIDEKGNLELWGRMVQGIGEEEFKEKLKKNLCK